MSIGSAHEERSRIINLIREGHALTSDEAPNLSIDCVVSLIEATADDAASMDRAVRAEQVRCRDIVTRELEKTEDASTRTILTLIINLITSGAQRPLHR